MGIYIRNGHLKALNEYKYAGQDKSLTSKYVLNPFWTKLATLFPENMAPNLITLTGFSFVVFNFITLLIYTPTLVDPCPPWVYASWGVGLFLYQTFDAIDGKQARRLGLSGPLGECFDHGVDALNTTVRSRCEFVSFLVGGDFVCCRNWSWTKLGYSSQSIWKYVSY
jgi:ethanolaminephosphotransferase